MTVSGSSASWTLDPFGVRNVVVTSETSFQATGFTQSGFLNTFAKSCFEFNAGKNEWVVTIEDKCGDLLCHNGQVSNFYSVDVKKETDVALKVAAHLVGA